MPNWKNGDQAYCSDCGGPITFDGERWEHEGPQKPRHPAMPTTVIIEGRKMAVTFSPKSEPDFSRPGPRVVGRINADGILVCPRCGSADFGPVDGGNPLCNGCNSKVMTPD